MPHTRRAAAPPASIPHDSLPLAPLSRGTHTPGPLSKARPAVGLLLSLAVCLLTLPAPARAQGKRRPPGGGRVAVVADERLAALRVAPGFGAALVRRLGRGSLVSLSGGRAERDGVTFRRVAVTRRTSGWLQEDALVSPARPGDDERLLRLARGSEGFDRLARARLLLELFPRSPLRPAALLLLGDAAEGAAERLTREAARRLRPADAEAGAAPLASYYLNYNGLDRYRRQGVVYRFEAPAGRFRYDGAAWRELLRRHPRSPEAAEALRRLGPAAASSP